MMRRNAVILAAALASLHATAAGAETRGALRLGLMTLDLQSSPDTPVFGEQVGQAVDRYNTAAAAYERASGQTVERIQADDLGVTETLFMISPGIEVGAQHYFFRLEAPIGLSSDLRSLGLGVYPLNLQMKPRRDVAAYLSAGGTASWLDRPGPGDVGGLIAARAAIGARIASRFLVEVGYSAFALGGNVNQDKLESMAVTAEDMAHPEKVVGGGEARGLFDVSFGVAF
ncbi:MAG TPA: hypothetical protein VNO30_43230 [Kofleriaceae bacterium]|nr:hypothetical protein [Kofleriaceae bacterium]